MNRVARRTCAAQTATLNWSCDSRKILFYHCIFAPGCCSGQLHVQNHWQQRTELTLILPQESKLSDSLHSGLGTPQLSGDFQHTPDHLIYSVPFSDSLVTLHLVCPRSFWCNPSTVYSSGSKEFEALPKMLGSLLSAFSLVQLFWTLYLTIREQYYFCSLT